MDILRGLLFVGLVLGALGFFAYRGVRVFDKAGYRWWVVLLIVKILAVPVVVVLNFVPAVFFSPAVFVVCFVVGVALSAVSARAKVAGVLAGVCLLAWIVGGWALALLAGVEVVGFGLAVALRFVGGAIFSGRGVVVADKST